MKDNFILIISYKETWGLKLIFNLVMPVKHQGIGCNFTTNTTYFRMYSLSMTILMNTTDYQSVEWSKKENCGIKGKHKTHLKQKNKLETY